MYLKYYLFTLFYLFHVYNTLIFHAFLGASYDRYLLGGQVKGFSP